MFDVCVVLDTDLVNRGEHKRVVDLLSKLIEDASENYSVPLEAKVLDLGTLGACRQRDPMFYHYLSERASQTYREWSRGELRPEYFSPYNKPPSLAS